MLVSARTAAWSGKHLPYDAEVEYLESTGTQWIDTGIKTLSSSTVEVEAASTVFNSLDMMFGSIGEDASSLIRALVYYDSSHGGRIISLQSGMYGVTNAFIAYDTAFHNYIITPTKAEVEGKIFSVTRSDNSLRNFLLFASVIISGTSYFSHARISRCKIYHSDVIVLDLIPVRKGNIGYMYDRVSGQLFGNQGTGAFIIGPDKTI